MLVMETEPGGGMGRCYVSALSEHPDSAQAAAEVTAQVLGRLGAVPELAVFFVTPPHRDAVGDIADVVREVLQPVSLLGAAAVAVLGPRREVEEHRASRCSPPDLAPRRSPSASEPSGRAKAGRSADSRPMSPAPGRCS